MRLGLGLTDYLYPFLSNTFFELRSKSLFALKAELNIPLILFKETKSYRRRGSGLFLNFLYDKGLTSDTSPIKSPSSFQGEIIYRKLVTNGFAFDLDLHYGIQKLETDIFNQKRTNTGIGLSLSFIR